MNMLQSRFSLLLVLVIFFGTGCASLFSEEDSDMNSSAEASEVSGMYTIQHYEFIPNASALEPINLLEYVEEESSTLELTQSQDFIFTYQTEEREEVKLTGPFELTSDLVTLKGQQKDAARYKRILLDQTFSLDRARANTLQFENQTEISPETIGSWYDGINRVEGTLRLKFAQKEKSTFGVN